MPLTPDPCGAQAALARFRLCQNQGRSRQGRL